MLVTGAAGMLGSQLCLDAPSGVSAVGTDLIAGRPEGPAVAAVGFDLTDPAAVERLVGEHGPFTGVIHSAAYTAVDKAEEERELAFRVNAEAPRVLARACAAADIPLVLVSTDFVFDGSKRSPYLTTDEPSPVGVYGESKRAGELAALEEAPGQLRIVRTQWLYGPRGNHFPGTILRLAAERDRLKVVSDQVGSPTTTLELAPALWDALDRAPAGLYHAACEGECSWYDLARATLDIAGVETPVEPCGTEEFPRPAPRPTYSALDSSVLGDIRGRRLKPWREALESFLVPELARTSRS